MLTSAARKLLVHTLRWVNLARPCAVLAATISVHPLVHARPQSLGPVYWSASGVTTTSPVAEPCEELSLLGAVALSRQASPPADPKPEGSAATDSAYVVLYRALIESAAGGDSSLEVEWAGSVDLPEPIVSIARIGELDGKNAQLTHALAFSGRGAVHLMSWPQQAHQIPLGEPRLTPVESRVGTVVRVVSFLDETDRWRLLVESRVLESARVSLCQIASSSNLGGALSLEAVHEVGTPAKAARTLLTFWDQAQSRSGLLRVESRGPLNASTSVLTFDRDAWTWEDGGSAGSPGPMHDICGLDVRPLAKDGGATSVAIRTDEGVLIQNTSRHGWLPRFGQENSESKAFRQRGVTLEGLGGMPSVSHKSLSMIGAGDFLVRFEGTSVGHVFRAALELGVSETASPQPNEACRLILFESHSGSR